MLLLALKRQDFVQICCWKTLLNIFWIRNQNLSKVGTGTAANHYGSTTLRVTLSFEKDIVTTQLDLIHTIVLDLHTVFLRLLSEKNLAKSYVSVFASFRLDCLIV
jgi:hypothetical protein